MTKKSKSTKQIRAIDRIIKFQIDDGIESLTISGKEVLADVAIDRQANVTLFLNADPDKINEIQSLVPFVTVQTVQGGTETDKTKTVTLSQDLTQFALEIADNSKELANLIKTQSSITLDLAGLVQQLLEIAGKLAELEQKNQEQDQRLTAIEEKNYSQDERLKQIGATQENHRIKLNEIENKNVEQDRLITIAQKTSGEHVYYLINNEMNTHRTTIVKYPNEEYDVTFENVWEGIGITFNVGNGTRTTKGLLLNTIITENMKNGCQIIRSTGAVIQKSYENRDNFIRFTFNNVTSPIVTIRIRMSSEAQQ